MDETGLKELAELLKAIRNRCDTCVLLIEHNATHLLATQLEDIHEDSQTIMDEYCIERQDD